MKTKILLLFATVFFLSISTEAQIDKGKYLLGGSVNYYSTLNLKNYSNSPDYHFLYSNVQFGKVVEANTVVGLIISYGNNDSHVHGHADSNYNKINQYSIGLFYRKYKKLFKKLYFFGETDAVYNYSDDEQGILQDKSDRFKNISNGGTLSFVPGVSYALCVRMQIELSMPTILSVSYSHLKTGYRNLPPLSNSNNEGNNFSFNANLNPTCCLILESALNFFWGDRF